LKKKGTAERPSPLMLSRPYFFGGGRWERPGLDFAPAFPGTPAGGPAVAGRPADAGLWLWPKSRPVEPGRFACPASACAGSSPGMLSRSESAACFARRARTRCSASLELKPWSVSAPITKRGTASERPEGARVASKLTAAPSTPLRIASAPASISSPAGANARPFASAALATSIRAACSFTERSMLLGSTPFAANFSARFSSASAGSCLARAAAIRASTRCATSAGNTSLRRAEGSLAGTWAIEPCAVSTIASSTTAKLRTCLIYVSSPEGSDLRSRRMCGSGLFNLVRHI